MSAAWLAHPEWLGALAATLVAAAAALLAGALRARTRGRRLLGRAAPPAAALFARDALLLAALAALALALLGPRLGERTEVLPSSGADVVLLLDVSRSMDARDTPPSRLERAQRAAAGLLARLEPGDRVALAAFGARGVLLTPLTPDSAALGEMLPAVDHELLRERGSNLASGVRAALGAYEEGSLRPRVLVVLSDGEDPWHGGELARVAAEAARAGVRSLAVAFGSEAGAAIPDHGAPLRDASGAAVRTRRELRALERLTDATRGALFLADAFGGVDVASLAAQARRDVAGAPGTPVLRRVPAVRVAPFAALALALLLAELALPWSGRGRPPHAGLAHRLRRATVSEARRGTRGAASARARRAAAAGLAALLAVAAADSPDPAREDDALPELPLAELEARIRARPTDPELLIHLGVARARRGQDEAAARAFGAAAAHARDPALVALAYYDLGVSALEARELERARDAFFDALVFAPGDRRTQFNLEWTLRALSERPPRELPAQGEAQRAGEAGQDGRRGVEASSPGESGAERGDAEPDGADGEAEPRPGDEERARGEEESAPGDDTRERGEPASAAAGGASLPKLTPQEAARWLSAVVDDPSRALREAARRASGEERGRPAGGAAW